MEEALTAEPDEEGVGESRRGVTGGVSSPRKCLARGGTVISTEHDSNDRKISL